MENRRILIDTSIIIEYLRSKNKEDTIFIKLFINNELCISLITIFELYNGASTETKKQELDILCNELEIIDFNVETVKSASSIYRDLRLKNKLIDIRDILIAANALQYNLKIATTNKKHFERIENVEFIK